MMGRIAPLVFVVSCTVSRGTLTENSLDYEAILIAAPYSYGCAAIKSQVFGECQNGIKLRVAHGVLFANDRQGDVNGVHDDGSW